MPVEDIREFEVKVKYVAKSEIESYKVTAPDKNTAIDIAEYMFNREFGEKQVTDIEPIEL